MLWWNILTPKKMKSIRRSAQLSSTPRLSFETKFVKDKSSGFSIVEVLVALAIMSVVTMGMMTLITNQTTEIKGIDEKMALQGVQTQVSNVLSSPAFCGCFIGTTRTFDYSATPKVWNTFPTAISSSYDGTCAAVGAAFLTVGTPLDPKLLPTAMSMQNITETTAGSGNFSANLVIQFDQTLLTRSRKSLSIPMYFTVNMADPVAARRLGTCSSAAAAPVDIPTLCTQMNGFYNGTTCEPTYQ